MFRRRPLSQNFLYNRTLVEKLVRRSSIGKNDLVLDLGSGKGIISDVLLQSDAEVIAVEVDSYYVQFCKQKFAGNNKITIIEDNILTFQLPQRKYKVFANIPFSIEGKLIRKLLEAENPPKDCYLLVRKDLAKRIVSRKSSLFLSKYSPFFSFSIMHYFKRSDFLPKPAVECVFLRFYRIDEMFLSWDERKKFWKFVELGYGDGRSIYRNLCRYFDLSKLEMVLNYLHIRKKDLPNKLSWKQWIVLYKALN